MTGVAVLLTPVAALVALVALLLGLRSLRAGRSRDAVTQSTAAGAAVMALIFFGGFASLVIVLDGNAASVAPWSALGLVVAAGLFLPTRRLYRNALRVVEQKARPAPPADPAH